MGRIKGERERLIHALNRLESYTRAIRLVCPVEHEIPSPDVGQSLVMAALEVATTLACLAAYQRADKDVSPRQARRRAR